MNIERINLNSSKLKTSAPPTFSQAEDDMRFSLLKDANVKKLKKDKSSLADMDSFEAYKHSVDFDRKKIEQARGHDEAKSLHGELLADIMAFRMNDYGWLGDKAAVTQTSEFDDRFAHADIICKFDNSENDTEDTKPAFLAIDCTVTEDFDVLRKKTGFTGKRFAEMEMLPDIKYYKDGADGKAGIKNVPRVIVAVEKSRLEEVCKAMLLADNNSETAIAKTKRSYLQLYMLYEIATQLNQQLHFVTQKFKSRAKMEHAFDSLSRTYLTIQKIIEQKESSLGTEISERAWKEFESSDVAMFLATDDLSLAA